MTHYSIIQTISIIFNYLSGWLLDFSKNIESMKEPWFLKKYYYS